MSNIIFDVDSSLKKIQHYLPAQAPLMDFVHHNTLHAFQNESFFDALQKVNEVFGYKTTLSLHEYRDLHKNGKISDAVIEYVLKRELGKDTVEKEKHDLFNFHPNYEYKRRIGKLRANWKSGLKLDLNTIVHLNLFKLVGGYLDQGIMTEKFPNHEMGFINAVRDLSANTYANIFQSPRVKDILCNDKELNIEKLLEILVGKEAYFEQYLFDQQFAHPGWSGMVAVVENHKESLLDERIIALKEFIYLELLLEIDALDKVFGIDKWRKIEELTTAEPLDLFENFEEDYSWKLKRWWQECFEYSYFDEVLIGLKGKSKSSSKQVEDSSFQAFFCIDDREESIRRHIEFLDPNCATFGTPAHFNLQIKYKPFKGKFATQVCPGVFHPTHIILEEKDFHESKKDYYFNKRSHGFVGGWIVSQTLGFWSALKLFVNVLRPTMSPGHSSSFEHMHSKSNLVYEKNGRADEMNCQVGFSIPEMVEIVSAELKRTGLTKDFAPLVYLFGHGGSSTNNPYYAGYNCGACSGRPSSVNSRVFARMANRDDVRNGLINEDVHIPESTQFIAGLHDTTRDEFAFYDEDNLNDRNKELHKNNKKLFLEALENNAKERARQFISIDVTKSKKSIHKKVKERSVALFEPRPELNHSNNCLCIVGSRKLTRNLFLDQRAFLNSYDYKSDPNGAKLIDILNAATPVCGGINLEYYFSRVDNENFGAGSKLPHNVVGLYGVSNGIEGDLRTGLPIQMVEVHDPLRLMMVVEQSPSVVLEVLKKNEATFEWYKNEWVKLAVIEPQTSEIFIFRNGEFELYESIKDCISSTSNLEKITENSRINLPVYNIV